MTETDTKEVEFNFGDIEVGESLEPEQLEAKEPEEPTEEIPEESPEETTEESEESTEDSSEAPPKRIRKKGTTLRKVKSESTAPNAFNSALARRFQRYDLRSGNNTLSLFNFY